MVNFTFRGLIAPTLAAFKNDLSLNLGIIQPYANFLRDSKIMGILVNGTSGEGMSMNTTERKLVTEEWVKAVKTTKQHLMVQIGGAPLPDVLELAKHAERMGVNSLLCLPELYNKPKNSTELIKYLSSISSVAPNTPLLYYHIPRYTNVNIHMGEFLNEVDGKIPTFSGIKFTSSNLDEGMSALKANGGAYAVFLGTVQLLAGAFSMGFDSAIGTAFNMFPELGITIVEAVKKSNLDEARKAQDVLTQACDLSNKYGGWVPSMKVAMELRTPIIVGGVRQPLTNLTPNQRSDLEKSLKMLK